MGQRDRPGFARTFDPQRIGYTRIILDQLYGHVGQVVRAGHAIVHERAGDELARLVVYAAFQQRLTNPLRQAALDLTFQQQWIDESTEVVHSPITQYFGLTGFGIDLDFAGMAAVGKSHTVCGEMRVTIKHIATVFRRLCDIRQ